MPGNRPYRSPALSGGVGFCNALRRVLMADLEEEAPYQVTVRTNTSYQTDEFIAHRIGLIPFRRVGNGDSLSLHVRGRDATTSDLCGPAFVPCTSAVIMVLREGQELDLTVHFDKKPGSRHARYSKVAAVQIRRAAHGQDKHWIGFETLDGSDGKQALLRALDGFEAQVDDALLQLGKEEVVVKSHC